MKKIYMSHHSPSGKWRKILFVMKIKLALLLCCVSSAYANPSFSQQPKLDVNYRNKTISSVLDDLKVRTGYSFVYTEDVKLENVKVSANFKDAVLEEILEKVLVEQGYDYNIKGKLIVINEREELQQPTTKTIRVTGRVVDEKGNPIVGATVVVNQTTRGTATDAQGRYVIQAREDDALKVSFLGYKEEMVLVQGRTTIDIQMKQTAENIEEVTVVAFGEQKKESVVSSITTIRAMDLKSSSSDLTSSFVGKIPGIIGWQTGGLPGALTEGEMNTKFYIRGISSFQSNANIDPLILIDNVESSKLELSRLAPEDIDTFSVLKDASATAMYGARGANGVIIITTKKGEAGSVYTSVRYEAVASMATSDIDVVDPVTYMQAYNQALISRDPTAAPRYSIERIEKTGSPDYPSWVYPANDWYETLFKKMSINHRFGLNIRGGGDVVQYYASLNHVRDNGMMKTDRLNDFNVNIRNSTTSFRTNLNIKLHTGIQLLLNTSINYDNFHGPMQDVTQAYYLAFNASPVDFAPIYPADDYYNWPHLRFGSERLSDESSNPYYKIQRGYKDRNRYNATARAEYIHNLSPILKGLEFRASVSFARTGYGSTPFTSSPATYWLEDYDFETGKHILGTNNPDTDRTLAIDRQNLKLNTANQIMFEGRLMHSAAWGGIDNTQHATSFTAVFNGMESNANPVGTVLNAFPRRNMGLSMRGTYGFKDRYFAEASFGYNGSERFAKKNRMGFFPAGGVAWIVSKERFMQSSSRWLSFLKLRASYGQVGNDGIISEPRFVYVPTIVTSEMYLPSSPRAENQYRSAIQAYPNPNIEWEIAEQVNLGLEAKLFGGLFEFTADAYQEIRHNIISNRVTIPATMGVEVPPMDNVGKVRSRGIDLSGKIQHMFNNDFWIILNGTFTYNTAKYLEIEEATNKPYWQRKKGHEISQEIGYIAEGLFHDQAEIDNSPFQGGANMKPGDIRYRDLNGDGIIDVNDATYIGFPTTPRTVYGINGFINYKNWEFSFAFQGSGKRSFFIDPSAISPFVGQRSMLKAIWDDHWTEDNMKDKPFWPRLSTSNITTHNPQENWNADKERRLSTYFMRECWFVRCTSLELSYNLPKILTKRLGLQNVKFTARANNPFIISDFDIWDVELGSNGFNYPIQKTYSLGLSVTF